MATAHITGATALYGDITINGAKNAALPIMAASLLFDDETITLENIPHIEDVKTMQSVLQQLRVTSTLSDHQLQITAPNIYTLATNPSDDLVSQMRATLLIMGALLATKKEVQIALPGGCSIGYRPINLHIMALEAMGAEISLQHGVMIGRAPQGLHAAQIHFDTPSVGATENAIMAAVKTKGTTVIENAAKEPEVVDLIRFLNLAGAKISGSGTSRLEITGVTRLHGITYEIIPDRVEAATYMLAVATAGGEVTLHNTEPTHLETVISKLQEIGVTILIDGDNITIRGLATYNHDESVDIRTAAYPGFHTDVQALMLPLLLKLQVNSVITDTVFNKRFQHTEEFLRVGANVVQLENMLIIDKDSEIISGKMVATDIRATAAMIILGIANPISLVVENIDELFRGYENFIESLNRLGANIQIEH